MHAASIGSGSRGYGHHEGAIRVDAEGDGILALCLEGEFDLANAPVLQDHIDDALAKGSDLVIDLSEVTFVDSSVINALFQSARAVEGREQTVVLQIATAPMVERVLELVEIERVLFVTHDRSEALEAIREQRLSA